MSRRQVWWTVVASVLVAAAAATLVAMPGWRETLAHLVSLETVSVIRQRVHAMGIWGPVLLIALMVMHSVAFFPSEVVTIADVALFGPVAGVAYSWIGSMLGAYLAFFLARAFGRPFVDRFVPERALRRFDAFMEHRGAPGVFVLRLIPLISFNALNYACGLTRLGFWRFTWTTGLGILPAGLLIALLYQSAVGQKYAFAGLTVIGIAALSFLAWRTRRRAGK